MDHVELFCEKLVILVKGKTVLNGYLKDIKDDYKMKRIIIEGNVNKNKLSKIKGVVNVTKNASSYIVDIENKKYSKDVFEYLKTCSNITKYLIEDASLEEIFLSKVGEAYGK